jgi:hypothetical protein
MSLTITAPTGSGQLQDDLNRIGDVAGIVSKGLPAAAIAALPTGSFTALQAAGKASMDK